jgi:hypothetical protein
MNADFWQFTRLNFEEAHDTERETRLQRLDQL